MKKGLYYKKTKDDLVITFRIPYSFLKVGTRVVFASLVFFLISSAIFYTVNFFRDSYRTAIFPSQATLKLYNTAISRAFVPQPVQAVEKVPIVFNGPRLKKQVALTFDADMTPEMKIFFESGGVQSYYDSSLISILNQTQTKATLFLSGLWMELYPDVTEDLAKNGLFELANHSFSHPSFSGSCYGLRQISDSQKPEEIQKTQELLLKFTGKTNTLFRFPGGCFSDSDLNIIQKNGLTAIQWDVAGQDGFNNNTDVIVNNVVSKVADGSIIVLHMNGYPNDPKTTEALPVIIATLKERGFEFVKVSELLQFHTNDVAQTRIEFEQSQFISLSLGGEGI